MEINKLDFQALLEIAINQKINGPEEVVLPQILNLYKNNLGCLFANLYELGKPINLNLDTAKLSLEFNTNLTKFTEEIDSSNNNAFYKKLNNNYFYALPLQDRVWLVLVKKNIFTKKIFFHLIKLVSQLGLEIKQSKEKERLQMLEHFLDKSFDSVQVSHENGQLFYINDVASKRLGIKKNEIQNYYVSDFEKIFKNNAESWHNHVNDLKKGGQFVVEGTHINKDNIHTTPVEVNVRLSKIKDKNFVVAISRDITKRKKQELKLLKTTQKLESIFNEMTDMVYSVKIPSNEVLFVTPSVKSILEIPEDEFIKNPNIWLSIVNSENKDLLLTIENDLKRHGEFSVKLKIKTSTGKIKWIKNRGKYIYDKNLNPIRLDGVFSDRTNEHLAKKALDDEIKLQDALIDIAATYIDLEPKNLNDTINKSLKKMGGFVNADRAYIFDYDFKKNTTSNTFEWCKEGISAEIDNLQKVPIEAIPQWVEKHKRGDSFYVENVALLNEKNPKENALKEILAPQNIKSLLTIPILNNKELIGFVGFDYVKNTHAYIEKEKKILALFGMMLIAIRNRQKLNNQLRVEGEKFQNIIANMNLGLLEVALDNTVIFANQSFCNMSGYQFNQLKRKNADQIFVDSLIAKDNKYLKDDNQASRNYEIKVKNKKGEVKWLFVSSAANYNDSGKLIGWIRVHLDITKQKNLEKEIAKAISSARSASKAKELFLANMSHEIRTPLNVIIGMIRELNKENLNATQHFYVSQSENSAKHLLTILNNILDITKIESGEMEIVKRVFNPSAMIYKVYSILTAQAQNKNLNLILDTNPDIYPALIGDDTRIKQVLINLTRNSIKFTNKGSIHLKVDLIHNKVDSQTLRFEVADTGIGMSSKFVTKIFEKFSQEQNTSNREYEGTGLGMAISNDLIKLMGSKMIIRSVKNEGTHSYFDLTLKKGNLHSLNSNIQLVKKGAFKGQNALLVEDNEMNRFITIKSLDYLGFTTTEAVNGLIATELITKQNFDIIFMDIQMPIMDGVEATRIIRNNLKIKTPIIAITANAFKHDIDLYLKVGMNDYITKPFDEKVLFKKVQSTLKESDFKDLKSNVLENESFNKTEEPLFDISKYKKTNGIDNEFIKKMVNMFINLADENILLLEKALEVDNVVTTRRIIHKIKPNIEVMGIHSLDKNINEILKFNVNSTITPKFISNTKKVIQVLKSASQSLKKRE
ncbi:PAS domain S-box protein [Polaribacter sp. R77954]|uniref:PAS domain S-box protein n=1 Tax=Polaribacter sp. R77954 TaxID=3093870 RepID=UPI0037C6B8D5